MPARKVTIEQLEVIERRIKAGESVGQLAREFGYYTANLSRLLKRRTDLKLFGNHWSVTLRLPEDPALIGYIAGLIDGEGSILNPHGGPLYHVSIGLTYEPTIIWLAQFGGKKNKGKQLHHKNMENRKLSWNWRVSRQRDVFILLKAVLPHLQVKREKALKALEHLQGVLRC